MTKAKRKTGLGWKIPLGILGVILLVVIGYLLYVFISYDRIPDRQDLEVQGEAPIEQAEVGKTYRIVTQNIGFGAYTADYTFFMDGGTESRAKSKESVIDTVGAAAAQVFRENPDFVFFQEVDTDSTRSYHVNEEDLLNAVFTDYQRVGAVNYHSAYLMYPILEPHGSSNSELLTYTSITATSSLRRSLPISTSVSKFLDLDRCYSVTRIPVENGKELVLYNVHLSAYGNSDEIRTAQMTMLFEDMQAEYEKGNYCVCGGDFNHDFTGDSTQVLNGGANTDYGWAQPFPEELLPDGILRCDNYTAGVELPTCRNCDVPYEEGNFTIIVDGFLVSANVTVERLENVQTGFVYSDHNPVVMEFVLQD
jgi:endonuclease/exonuclease/phosphatase family metal-dependent hydrolase